MDELARTFPSADAQDECTGRTSELVRVKKSYAGVAKLADALALGASEVTHGGSSPLPGTKKYCETHKLMAKNGRFLLSIIFQKT